MDGLGVGKIKMRKGPALQDLIVHSQEGGVSQHGGIVLRETDAHTLRGPRSAPAKLWVSLGKNKLGVIWRWRCRIGQSTEMVVEDGVKEVVIFAPQGQK